MQKKHYEQTKILGTHHPPCGGVVQDFDIHMVWNGDGGDGCCGIAKCVKCGKEFYQCEESGWKEVACTTHHLRMDWCPPNCR